MATPKLLHYSTPLCEYPVSTRFGGQTWQVVNKIVSVLISALIQIIALQRKGKCFGQNVSKMYRVKRSQISQGERIFREAITNLQLSRKEVWALPESDCEFSLRNCAKKNSNKRRCVLGPQHNLAARFKDVEKKWLSERRVARRRTEQRGKTIIK